MFDQNKKKSVLVQEPKEENKTVPELPQTGQIVLKSGISIKKKAHIAVYKSRVSSVSSCQGMLKCV